MKIKPLIEDMLCDLYDIQNMARLHQFGDLPKDNEGTETTISDCIENCINHLKEIENGLVSENCHWAQTTCEDEEEDDE